MARGALRSFQDFNVNVTNVQILNFEPNQTHFKVTYPSKVVTSQVAIITQKGTIA